MNLPLVNEKGLLSHVDKIIAIGSGKGGVGKSTMTVNIALALKALGLKVGILDADIYGPSIARMLPCQVAPEEKGEILTPAISKGISYMSMGLFGDEGTSNAVRAPIANAMINKFLHRVDWGKLDVLIVDLPPGTGDIPLTLMQSVKLAGAVVVTTPQYMSVIDVKKCIEMLQMMDVRCFGVIENMSFYQDPISMEVHHIFSEGGGEALSKEFSIPFLGKVPLEPLMCQRLDSGGSIFDVQKDTPLKNILYEIGVVLRGEICDNSTQENGIIGCNRSGDRQLKIEFQNGSKGVFSFNEIQAMCPCARCVDEFTGMRIIDPEHLDVDVDIEGIEEVGNYGFRFQFSRGCKQGIYTWKQFAGALST